VLGLDESCRQWVSLNFRGLIRPWSQRVVVAWLGMSNDPILTIRDALSTAMDAVETANAKLMEARAALESRPLDKDPRELRAQVEAWTQTAEQLRIITAKLIANR